MEIALRPFNNRNLFSNHYLENQIKDAPEWARSDHEVAFEKIKKIYDRESAFVGNLSESQLEDRLFRSLFAVLLPSYEVQGATKSREFPDYAFFPDREAQDRAQAGKDTDSFFLEAFAVGEVKRWDAELDRFGKDRQDKRPNPSFQIWLYLHETEPAWGILSNGVKWRLYRQERPLDVYYEVDLPGDLCRRRPGGISPQGAGGVDGVKGVSWHYGRIRCARCWQLGRRYRGMPTSSIETVTVS
ncbi:MAG TPA: hypothetical protein PLY09_06230 [Methanothrix sp.]|nr:hypothetical protein [Methanothrix sp.]